MHFLNGQAKRWTEKFRPALFYARKADHRQMYAKGRAPLSQFGRWGRSGEKIMEHIGGWALIE